jgi:hypothetical protein
VSRKLLEDAHMAKTIDEAENLKIARQMLTMQRDRAKEKLSVFMREFTEADPFHALEWSASTFEAAASFAVAERLLASTATVEQLHQFATKQALKGAQFPTASTSVTGNFASLRLTAAWAQAAEDLSGFVTKKE